MSANKQISTKHLFLFYHHVVEYTKIAFVFVIRYMWMFLNQMQHVFELLFGVFFQKPMKTRWNVEDQSQMEKQSIWKTSNPIENATRAAIYLDWPALTIRVRLQRMHMEYYNMIRIDIFRTTQHTMAHSIMNLIFSEWTLCVAECDSLYFWPFWCQIVA